MASNTTATLGDNDCIYFYGVLNVLILSNEIKVPLSSLVLTFSMYKQTTF